MMKPRVRFRTHFRGLPAPAHRPRTQMDN
jgi:hypothetical protein